jgi:hypothetical protein
MCFCLDFSFVICACVITADITVAKVLLRSICCLASCHSFKVEGPGGLLEILTLLLNTSYAGWPTTSTHMSAHAQTATYLMSVSMPYIANLLVELKLDDFLSRAVAQCARVVSDYVSVYNRGNTSALFHANTVAAHDEDDSSAKLKNLSVGPDSLADRSVQSWDTLWEACKVALDVITQARTQQSASASASGSAEATATTTVSGGFVPPSCVPQPWREIPSLCTYTESGDILSFEASYLNELDAFWTLTESNATHKQAKALAAAASWLYPVFAIFDEESSAICAVAIDSMSAIERITCAQYVRDVLYFFNPIIRTDGTLCGSLELLLNHLLAISRLYAHELVDRAKVYTHHIMVETIMQLMVRSAVSPPHTHIAPGQAASASAQAHVPINNAELYRVLLELCRREQTVPPILASAASILFQFTNDLDIYAVKEIAHWLSFHLTNTKLSWPYWDFFVSEFNEAPANSQLRTFVALLVDELGRSAGLEASSSASIKRIIPADLHGLLPADPTPVCAYLGEGSLVHPDNVAGAEDAPATPKEGASGENDESAAATDAAVDAKAAAAMKSGMAVTEGVDATSALSTLLAMAEAKAESEDVETWMEEIDTDGVDMSALVSVALRSCLRVQNRR